MNRKRIIEVYYAAMAGYDPGVRLVSGKKCRPKAGKRKMPQFLSTHPNPGNRIQFLEEQMPHALGLYREAKRARGERPNP